MKWRGDIYIHVVLFFQYPKCIHVCYVAVCIKLVNSRWWSRLSNSEALNKWNNHIIIVNTAFCNNTGDPNKFSKLQYFFTHLWHYDILFQQWIMNSGGPDSEMVYFSVSLPWKNITLYYIIKDSGRIFYLFFIFADALDSCNMAQLKRQCFFLRITELLAVLFHTLLEFCILFSRNKYSKTIYKT